MIQQNFFDARERFYECLECNEAIFNPICPSCLAVEIEAWLSSYPDKKLRDKILFKIRAYLEKTQNLVGKSVQCVACKHKRASLCPYCFTNNVFNILKDMKVNKIMLREFLQFFNYDFDHVGYSKDAEALGVI